MTLTVPALRGDYIPPSCRVYWGTHGCDLPRGHEGHHRCDCADDPCDCKDDCCIACPGDERCVHNVGAFPYYGPGTKFYGEDSEGA